MTLEQMRETILSLEMWGVVPGLVILALGAIFSMIILRRIYIDTDLDINRAGMIALSTILFLCSGAWSGWALFLTYQESNLILAWVLAGGLVVVGGVTSVVLQSFSKLAVQESGSSRAIVVLCMAVITVLWLGISPVYNAMTICRHTAIQSEIALRFQDLNRTSAPIVEKYNLFRSKVIPLLVNMQEFLEESIAQQEEIGGCGPICKKYKTVFQALEPSVARLFEEYSPDDEDSNFANEINNLQQQIFNLLTGTDLSAEEMRMNFFRLANRWNGLLFKAKNTDDPVATLNRVVDHQAGLLLYLKAESTSDTMGQESIKYQALQAALMTLTPKLEDLKLLMENRAIGVIKSSGQLLTNISNNIDVSSDISNVASMKITPALLWKHVHLYWNSLVLAFFIDFLAIAIVLLPMGATILRSRPMQRAIEAVRKCKMRVREIQSDLDTLVPLFRDIEKNDQKLFAKYERNLSGLQKEKEDIIDNEDSKASALLATNAEKRQECIDEHNKLMEDNQDDLEMKLKGVTSSSEEKELRGQYSFYTNNLKLRFEESINQIAVAGKALKENRNQILAGIEENFSQKQQAIQDRHNQRLEILEKRKEATVTKKAGLEAQLNKANTILQVKEDELGQLQEHSTIGILDLQNT
jgi:hypothetical protein